MSDDTKPQPSGSFMRAGGGFPTVGSSSRCWPIVPIMAGSSSGTPAQERAPAYERSGADLDHCCSLDGCIPQDESAVEGLVSELASTREELRQARAELESYRAKEGKP